MATCLNFKAATALALVIGLPGTQATAQSAGDLVQAETVASSQSITIRRFPSVYGAPSAFAGAPNAGFVGLSYVSKGGDANGDIAAGYTFGNAVEAVSVTGTLVISDLDDFADSGNLNMSLSRLVATGSRSLTFVGATVNDLAGWGKTGDASYRVYASHIFTVGDLTDEFPMQVTFGYGDTAKAVKGKASEGGFFGGVGVGLTANLGVSASFTESQVNAGVSFGIPQVPGLGVSIGVSDIGENVGDRTTFLSLGYGF